MRGIAGYLNRSSNALRALAGAARTWFRARPSCAARRTCTCCARPSATPARESAADTRTRRRCRSSRTARRCADRRRSARSVAVGAPRRRDRQLVAAARAPDDLAESRHVERLRRDAAAARAARTPSSRRLLLAPRLARLVLIAALAIFAFGHEILVRDTDYSPRHRCARRRPAARTRRAGPVHSPRPLRHAERRPADRRISTEEMPAMTRPRRLAPPLSSCRPARLSTAGCDIVTADSRRRDRSEWRKSYELQPGGRVEISNVNGKIDVEPSTRQHRRSRRREDAPKRAATEAAKEALERIEIEEDVSPSAIRIETQVQTQTGGWFSRGSGQVELHGARAGRRRGQVLDGQRRHRDHGAEGAHHRGNHQRRRRRTRRQRDNRREHDERRCGRRARAGRRGRREAGMHQRRDQAAAPLDAKADITASITNGGIEHERPQHRNDRVRPAAGSKDGSTAAAPRIRIEGTNGGIRISAR